MADPELVERLMQHLADDDIQGWNEWYSQQDWTGERANFMDARLEGADFRGAQLERADFRGARLEGADFRGAQLEEARFIEARLGEARFTNAQLKGAIFLAAYLERTNFANAQLNGAEFGYARLEGADFTGAQLEGALFRYSRLEGANFRFTELDKAIFTFAKLRHTNFMNARLEKAAFFRSQLEEVNFEFARLGGAGFELAQMERVSFKGAQLNDADLRGAQGYILDECEVRGTRFDPDAKDPWSVLRRSYTGPMLLFNVILLIAFVTPLFLQIAFWGGVNRAQEAASLAAERTAAASVSADSSVQARTDMLIARLGARNQSLVDQISDLSTKGEWNRLSEVLRQSAIRVQEGDAEAARLIRSLDSAITALLPDSSLFTPCLQNKCQEHLVYTLLFSGPGLQTSGSKADSVQSDSSIREASRRDTGVAFLPTLGAIMLTAGLFVYNGLRAYLTRRVGLLRDAEERSQITPGRTEYEELFTFHRVLVVLLWVSVAAFVYNALYWLSLPVSLPA
ncbi:MAG: pentapeptide repeat-containing protein [Bacteroidota bacterium]